MTLNSLVLQLRFVFQCKLQDGVMAVETELLTDARAVVLDSAVVNEQFPGDFLARLAARNHPEDAAFGGGETGQVGLALSKCLHAAAVAEEMGRKGRGHVVLSGCDRPYATRNVADRRLF